MNNKIRIVVADDHPLFRKGICLFLEDHPDIEVIKELANGKEVIEFLNRNQSIDVVVMDLQMPLVDGEEATKVIGEKWPNVKVLVLTSYGSGDKVHSLLSSGAQGYLLKDAKPDELVTAIKAIHMGGTYIGNQVLDELLNRVPKREHVFKDLMEPLTEREIEVLTLIGKGLSNSKISEHLHISLNTVKTHVGNIYQKLDVKSRTQAAFYAMQEGLIE